MCMPHKLQSLLTGTTMRGSLSMLSKVSSWLTTSTAKLFLQKEKKLHSLYLQTDMSSLPHTYWTNTPDLKRERKTVVLDRWMMAAFLIQGNKKMDCWTNRLNCLNAPIYRGKNRQERVWWGRVWNISNRSNQMRTKKAERVSQTD